ncbi:MAG: hypothetical protein HC922_09115 [Leptolyngbyaceae cyanobacterium SM2_3_12]|nr:hypothetical protein [Leptolyngbyaceae cyanobacterium SM2_3_12]
MGILVGSSFVLLWLGGWWLPLVPTLLVFMVNGIVLPGFYLFYLYDQTLQLRLRERQWLIEHTYDTIHNGPLQTLALLLKEKATLPLDTSTRLETLNRELREVHNRLMQGALPETDQFPIGSQHIIDLRHPFDEVLYEVYAETLRRNFPGFSSIKFQVIKFEPLRVEDLSTDDKRALCRFLEEALCNIGKHAVAPTRLTVLCLATATENLIRIEDNGKTLPGSTQTELGGRGTQQAQDLARRLGGTFQRILLPQGMRCELRWPLPSPRPWWRF